MGYSQFGVLFYSASFLIIDMADLLHHNEKLTADALKPQNILVVHGVKAEFESMTNPNYKHVEKSLRESLKA